MFLMSKRKKYDDKFLIDHGEGYTFKMLFHAYIGICDGNWIAAALLAEIEQLQSLIFREIKQDRRYKRKERTEWFYLQDEALVRKLQSSRSAIQRALNLLEEKNFIQIWYYGQENPSTDNINYKVDVSALKLKRLHKAKCGINPTGWTTAMRWLKFNKNVVQYKVYEWQANNGDANAETKLEDFEFFYAMENQDSKYNEEISQNFIKIPNLTKEQLESLERQHAEQRAMGIETPF